ncbi:MAG: hypothetical protein R2725_16290 [Solirubrobacterales bacterium]
MIGRNALLGLLAVLAVALAPGAAAAASTAADGTSAIATPSKGKKGKGKTKSCKGKKGKARKRCQRKQKNKHRQENGSGKLANGLYEDPRGGVAFKVTGGGSRIQLDKIELRELCVPLEAGSGEQVPLNSRKGSLVADGSFQVVGGGTLTVAWSAEIDPKTLRYTLEHETKYVLGSSSCEDSGRIGGKLSH